MNHCDSRRRRRRGRARRLWRSRFSAARIAPTSAARPSPRRQPARARARPSSIANAKKKQIAENLAELEKRSKSKRVDLQTRIEQAGLPMKKQQFLMIFVAIAVGARRADLPQDAQPAASRRWWRSRWPSARPNFVLARLTQAAHQEVHRRAARRARHHRARRARRPAARRHAAHHRQRGAGAGAVRIPQGRRIAGARHFRRRRPARRWRNACRRPRPTSSPSSSKSSPRRAAICPRRSATFRKTVRERKKMKGKIGAMSMEALASAAIIGAVPFLVTGALYVISPNYMSLAVHHRARPLHPHLRARLDEHRRDDDEEDDQLRLLTEARPCSITYSRKLWRSATS